MVRDDGRIYLLNRGTWVPGLGKGDRFLGMWMGMRWIYLEKRRLWMALYLIVTVLLDLICSRMRAKSH